MDMGSYRGRRDVDNILEDKPINDPIDGCVSLYLPCRCLVVFCRTWHTARYRHGDNPCSTLIWLSLLLERHFISSQCALQRQDLLNNYGTGSDEFAVLISSRPYAWLCEVILLGIRAGYIEIGEKHVEFVHSHVHSDVGCHSFS